jgi:glycosyltransferase involved in cell wall biosynthesis
LPEGFLVGYIGRFEPLGTDKGLRLMIEALKALPHNINLVLVGGTKDEVVQYTNIALKVGVLERVTIVSHIAPSLVPKYQKACDVLAYVPRGHTIFYEKETSPMKIFEYMAAKRPMILSSVPTSTALVPSDAAYFAEPGSVQSFIEVVCNVERNSVEAGKRAERAFALVRENTWGRRAERILKDLS